MLEQFLESDKIKKHALNIFVLGIAYVVLGYLISAYFFKESVSVAMLFTATLFLVPAIYNILAIEEKIESRQGSKNFFQNHKDIFKIYFFLFLGIFVAFIILGNYSNLDVFQYQNNFLDLRGNLEMENVPPSFENVLGFISQNLLVVIIAFVLSIFYGAGALFLIVLNASVFAAFIHYIIQQTGKFSLFGLFLIHLVPELSGFLLAAISGGVVSRAIMSEKFGTDKFRNVMKDALILLLMAGILIVIAAFLEVYVSGPLARSIL